MASVVRNPLGSHYTVELTGDELSIVLACLREAWEALSDDDFRVRTGFSAERATDLRESLRAQLGAATSPPGDRVDEGFPTGGLIKSYVITRQGL